ncbi:hypothetical protein [Streptomyces sp. NPDC056190]|uniref:hypothetical protein n=1 Tax=Streptomyces sp. NPDC056190 TaxID=3345741 RepID=UPI0035DC5DBA
MTENTLNAFIEYMKKNGQRIDNGAVQIDENTASRYSFEELAGAYVLGQLDDLIFGQGK